MVSQTHFEGLVERINAGIAKTGCHIVTAGELDVLWRRQPIADEEKRAIMQDFAAQHGFIVDLGPGLLIAAFQKQMQ